MTTCRSERQARSAFDDDGSNRLDHRVQMSGIPAHRESRSQRGILRRPDRGIPIYQTAGAYSTRFI